MTNSWSTGTPVAHCVLIGAGEEFGEDHSGGCQGTVRNNEYTRATAGYIFKSTWRGKVCSDILKSQSQPGEVVWHCGKCPGLKIRGSAKSIWHHNCAIKKYT